MAVRPTVGDATGNRSSALQLRGITPNANGYREIGAGNDSLFGNLGVLPIVGKRFNDAHQLLSSIGLIPSDRVQNLGQFNASTGDTAYHINLINREFQLKPGSSIAQLGA